MLAIRKTVTYGDHTITIEAGIMARQADGSVLVDMGGTSVLCAVVGRQVQNAVKDFFPLRIDYQERAYASGKIPGGFFKREGRPSEREILIARLIDRPIRPLFPKGFRHDVQVVATLISLNPEIEPDILAMIGTSAALAISGIPFTGPMGASRVAYVDGDYILNPTQEEIKTSSLDLVVAGTETSVLMVESEASELSEDVMHGAIMFGHQGYQSVIIAIKELSESVDKIPWSWKMPKENIELKTLVRKDFESLITSAYQIQDKLDRQSQLKILRADIVDKVAVIDETMAGDLISEETVLQVISSIEQDIVRGRVIHGLSRIDGRGLKTVRPISIQISVLPRTHGSALFTRGETQSLGVVTLGTAKDAQISDNSFGDNKENFMLHYNFPPYCVGEIGMIGTPKRREIGHGHLAKRAIQAVMPSMDDFPYVIRVVSEVTESNGSSSMATVCSSSLALMDAGVPISAPVAGIAMGLIKEGDNFAILSDILGDEDYLGDMDFKVAGTEKGVTALQMDIKIDGITEEIMSIALAQAKEGRLHILDVMEKIISAPKDDISNFAPRIISFSIKPEKIKNVIGKGGATISGLIEDTGATIDIQKNGTVQIATIEKSVGDELRKKIERLTEEVVLGKIYKGTVVRIVDFGAFVNILPGKDGLVHISQIASHRVAYVTDELADGQVISVKVLEIDRQGRIKLSIKEAVQEMCVID